MAMLGRLRMTCDLLLSHDSACSLYSWWTICRVPQCARSWSDATYFRAKSIDRRSTACRGVFVKVPFAAAGFLFCAGAMLQVSSVASLDLGSWAYYQLDLGTQLDEAGPPCISRSQQHSGGLKLLSSLS